MFSIYAQDNLKMYEKNKVKFGIILRGKVIGGGILEDLTHFNITSGLEFRFLKYHSIGIDYVYLRQRFEEESYDSVSQDYIDNGFSNYSLREYFLVDYRFYINLFPKKNIFPYISLFTKVGEIKNWYHNKSILGRTGDYNYRAVFNDYGVALGTHIGISPNGRVGLDVNIGAVKRETSVAYGTYPSKTWAIHMRLNLYFNLFKTHS